MHLLTFFKTHSEAKRVDDLFGPMPLYYLLIQADTFARSGFRLNAPTLFLLRQCKYSQKYEELLTGVFELRGAADRV